MTQITVNTDAGEPPEPHLFGMDLEVMDNANRVNIACVWHVGDPGTMGETVAETIRRGIAVRTHPGLPAFGTAGAAHETVYQDIGVALSAELNVGLDHWADGSLTIQRRPALKCPESVADRVRSVLGGQQVEAVDGSPLDIHLDSTFIQSDIPGAPQLTIAARQVTS